MGLGWPLPKRKQYLSDLAKSESKNTHPVRFQGKPQYMPVHSVPLDLPRYRLENGRTTGSQAEYLASNADADEDFFRVDGESEAAQQAQHIILQKLSRGSKNLFQEFDTGEQEEPIILSAIGYVINGNRRLSTWRALYEEDPAKYARFATIEAIILPPCDDRDLDRLEAELQLKEDLKAEYSWTSQALMMREKMQRFDYNEAEISSIYDFKKGELQELLDCLDYADEYLTSRGAPRQYSQVDGKEFAFRQICRSRKKVKSPQEREMFEKSAFCLTDDAAEGTRTYAEIQKAADNLQEIASDLVEEFEVEAEGKAESEVAEELSAILSESENFDRARETIQETIAAATARARDRKKEQHVASRVEQAKQNLIEAREAINEDSSRKGVASKLDDITALVDDLRQWAKDDE
ncbi:MAG: hypothetical protein AAF936_15555 [Pseudomonadota bacterium]